MKHTKLIIAIVTVAMIAAAPVFARGQGNARNPNPQKMMNMRTNDCPCGNCQMMNHPSQDRQGKDFMRGQKMGIGRNVSLMGTIKSIDANKSMIVVTDVDGKDFTVHVNPQTRIAICTDTVKLAELSELNKNDWVQISKFETNTTIIEACRIGVIRENK